MSSISIAGLSIPFTLSAGIEADIAKASDEFVFVLPKVGNGSPFLLGSSKRDDNYALLCEGVGGRIEPVPREQVCIRPSVEEACPRWALAREMLRAKTTKVYVNEEGSYTCGKNYNTIIAASVLAGKMDCFRGRVVVVITRKTFNLLGIIPDVMTLVPETGDYKQPVFMTELN
jgi:hypothetical protein